GDRASCVFLHGRGWVGGVPLAASADGPRRAPARHHSVLASVLCHRFVGGNHRRGWRRRGFEGPSPTASQELGASAALTTEKGLRRKAVSTHVRGGRNGLSP